MARTVAGGVRFAVMVAVAVLIAGNDGAAREWTNRDGRTISADLVKVAGDQVTLRKEDGRQYTVPITSLSDADQAHLKRVTADAAAGSQTAADHAAAAAPAPQPPAPPASGKPAGLADFEAIDGPATARIGDMATIKVPEGYMFMRPKECRQLLEMMGNPTDGGELGMLAPMPFDWFVVFEFDKVGFVKDDDKDKLDAKAMLESIRKGSEEANKERRKRGWAELKITGWYREPSFNDATKNLEWAILGSSEGERIVNYNTRLLGRRGVMEASLVCDPEQLDDSLPAFQTLLKGYAFESGHRYADFRQGDAIAKYGLAALVTGGAVAVAAQSGLLRHLGKLIAVAVAAVGGFFKMLFGGGQRSRE